MKEPSIMEQLRHNRWFRLTILLALIACARAWGNAMVRSEQDRSEVAKITESMKTVCVGRYLIDVPAQADMSQSHETVAGFDIQTIEESEAAFHKRVGAREATIAARADATDGAGGIIEARDLRTPNIVGRILVYGLNRSYSMNGDIRMDDKFVSVEAHAHMDGWSFSLTARYADETRAKLAEAMLARLRLRGENEILSEAGFCIRRALFVEPMPVRKSELSVLHVGLPGHPDLGMAFVSMPGGDNDPGLLARSADIDASDSITESLRVTRLRGGPRKIHDIDGQEVLERARELNLATTYGFMWETQGVKDDPLHPFLSLELQAGINPEPGGKPVGASLHQDAILALWDAVSSSIRLRPHDAPSATVRARHP